MQITTVTLLFSKKVSDGNYGHEAVDVFLSADLTEGDDVVDVGEVLSRRGRDVAWATLNQSPSIAVRRALEPQVPREPHPDEL